MEIAIILNTPSEIGLVKEQNVIYVDGGYKFNKKLSGKNVLAVVGDFDSLDGLDIPCGAKVLNPEKDFTDGEYAVRCAKDFNATSVSIYGATGGRLDHVLCNISLLKIAKDLGINAKLCLKGCTVNLVQNTFEFKTKKGNIISILPYGNQVVFESSLGLKYPLDNLTLTNGDTRGISNVATGESVSLKVKSGQALVFIYS